MVTAAGRRDRLWQRFVAQVPGRVVLMAIAWVAAIQVATFAAGYILPPGSPLPSAHTVMVDQWFQFDANYYLAIAESGYPEYHPSAVSWDTAQAAFFPAYPLLGAALSAIFAWGFDLKECLLLVNWMLAIAAAVFTHLLARVYLHDPELSHRTVLYLLAFPLAFFLIAPYTEALFISSATGALYFAATGRWKWAALLGIVATATRVVGVVVPLGMLLIHLEQQRWVWRAAFNWRVLAACAATFLGLGGFMAYQYLVFGDPLYFATVNELGWHRTFEWDVVQSVRDTYHAVWTFSPYYGVMTLMAVMLFAWLSIEVIRKVSVALGVYCVAMLALPALNSTWISMNRYTLPLIPCFFILAQYGERRWFHYSYLFGGLLLLVVCVEGYRSGLFIG